MKEFLDSLNFNEKGLIPAVIQDNSTGDVLTLCYMNRDAIEKTIQEGLIYVFRRSHGRLMLKGESSGCTQEVKALFVDCADNSLLFKVDQKRAACHEGYFSCYFKKIDKNGIETIEEKRIFDPKDVYK
ncbi:MAG: phosphoribosyl-AMP cyclohydrolase [Candidatus Omnitrophica bacterium]|nr:phosphoribosyl-AMP cyclohydrolase [Candidatus Omnitrophota bacterium]